MKNNNRSIINWELHQKLQKKRKIDTKYRYKISPNGKKPGGFKRILLRIKNNIIRLINFVKNVDLQRR